MRLGLGCETSLIPPTATTLRRDWFVQNGVRLYFGVGFLQVGNRKVPLQEDIHIASLVRFKSNIVLKTKTASICVGKVKDSYELPTSHLYSISAVNVGYVSSEPGLMVSNSVTKLSKGRAIPIKVVNNTNQTLQLSRGCVVAKTETIGKGNNQSINTVMRNAKSNVHIDWNLYVDVPGKQKAIVVNFHYKRIRIRAHRQSENENKNRDKTTNKVEAV